MADSYYRFLYKWNNYPKIQEYIQNLLVESYKDIEVRNQLFDIVHDVEEFFYTGITEKIFTRKNLPRIMKSLNNSETGFRRVSFLPSSLSGVYGHSTEDRIEINRKFASQKHKNSPSLTDNDLRRLYLYHEIGHKILHILDDENTIRNYVDTVGEVLKEKGMETEDLNYNSVILDGFWMIEESLTQELAEFLTYKSLGKERPKKTNRYDLGSVYMSNHDFYGIFQTPTVNIGKTMRDCSNCKTDEEVMLNMIKKALNTNFDLELISEYSQGDANQYYDLFKILRCMGLLKLEKYAAFGQAEKTGYKSSDLLNVIKLLTNRNSNRDYPEEGNKVIDFNKYKKSHKI